MAGTSGDAQDILDFWAYVDYSTIQWDFIAPLSELPEEELGSYSYLHGLSKSKDAFLKGLQDLQKSGLLEQTSSHVYRMPSDLAERRRLSQTDSQRRELAVILVRLFGLHARRDGGTGPGEQLISHARNYSRFLADTVLNDRTELEESIALEGMIQIAELLYAGKELAQTERFYLGALQGYQKAATHDNTLFLQIEYKLGVLYHDQGRVVEAEKLLLSSSQGLAETHGAEAILTLDALEYLAMTYRKLHKLNQAEETQSGVVERKKAVLGLDNPSTLVAINRLGMVYSAQKRFVEAETTIKESWEGCMRVLGPNHEATLRAVTSLGNIAIRKNELVEADTFYTHAFNGYKAVYGPGHSTTLTVAGNLASVRIKQRKLEEAESMLLELSLLGEQENRLADLRFLNLLFNLAQVLSLQERPGDAETTLRKVLSGYKKVFGPDHAKTLDIVKRLGWEIEKQGRLQESQEMFELGFQSSTKTLGPYHAVTTDAAMNLSRVLGQQGKLDETQKMLTRLLEAYEAVLGKESKEAIETMCSLGVVLIRQRKLSEAHGILSLAYERCKSAFGPEDARTLYTCMVLCSNYEMQGRLSDVEHLVLHLLQHYQGQPVLEDQRTGALFDSLAGAYERKGKLAEAEPLLSTAHAIYEKKLGEGDKDTILIGLRLDRLYRQIDRKKDEQEGLYREETETDSLIASSENAIRRILQHNQKDASWSLFTLGSLYREKFNETRRKIYLDSAISKVESSIHLLGDNIENRAQRLRTLSIYYHTRYELTNKLEDLQATVDRRRLAVNARDADDAAHAMNLNRLSVSLLDLHEKAPNPKNVDEAAQASSEALKLVNEDDPEKDVYFKDASLAFFFRYQKREDLVDLEIAERYVQAALQLTPVDNARWSSLWALSAEILRHRSQHTGSVNDLDQAIERTTEAVNRLGKGSQSYPILLESLAKQLRTRYFLAGRVKDLEESIRHIQTVLAHIPDDDKYRFNYLQTISLSLIDRFERTGRLEDLDRAISYLEESCHLGTANLSSQIANSNFLGYALCTRFQYTKDPEDLESSIKHTRHALRLTSDDPKGALDILNNLAIQLRDRFHITGSLADIEESVTCLSSAVSQRPPGHMSFAGNMNNLALSLESKFDKTKDIRDLNLAIEKAEQACQAAASNGNMDGSGNLYNLSGLYQTRYLVKGEQTDSDCATQSSLQGWQIETGRPLDRVKAASRAIERLIDQKRYKEACNLAMDVIDYFPTINNQSLDISDQLYVVTELSGIPGHAGALLIQDGQLEKALEFLEKGRAVILDLLIGSHTGVAELSKSHPELASTFESLKAAMNQSSTAMGMDSFGAEAAIQKRLETVHNFNECVKRIRDLPGHDRFLLSPRLETIMAGAKGGRIVMVNITRVRSDAIIIARDIIQAIELPRLSYTETRQWLSKDLLRKAKSQAERRAKNEEYLVFLSWLWDSCVKPILNKAGYISSLASTATEGQSRRIWWIGCGIANTLPFHAAGDHDDESQENTFSYAVSSYAPSIKMLFHARKRSQTMSLDLHPKLLIVGMPTTPNHASLPGVEEEMEEITETVEDLFSVQSLTHPNPQQVISGLLDCDMVHFACHALSHSTKPTEGHLLLQGDPEDTGVKSGKLTVEQMLQINLQRARIAYLSACSTAENRAQRLRDEVIHLGSAFQIAGFAHVFGTMWPTADSISRDVATGFYTHLTRAFTYKRQDNDGAVAVSFHTSVNDIRLEWPEKPLFWAQFVHFGA